jgi:4-hydroxybenzoate polyprenyltransferase
MKGNRHNTGTAHLYQQKKYLKSKYVRLLRPKAWITYLLPFSIGFGLGITSKSNPIHVIFAFITFALWMSFCFVLNALSDKDTDKFHNGRTKDMNLAYQPLVTKEVTEKEALYLSLIFLILSLFFAFLINPLFFSIILFVHLWGYIYSMPPMRLKMRPVADILCNVFAGGGIFVAGLSIGGANMNPLMILGVFLAAATFYIPTVVTDYEFDKKAGLKTSAVFFGPEKIIKAMYSLTLIATILWLIVLLTSNLELQLLALIVIIYSVVITLASNSKMKEGRLYIHENWVLAPFLLLSATFIMYGILKLSNLL